MTAQEIHNAYRDGTWLVCQSAIGGPELVKVVGKGHGGYTWEVWDGDGSLAWDAYPETLRLATPQDMLKL